MKSNSAHFAVSLPHTSDTGPLLDLLSDMGYGHKKILLQRLLVMAAVAVKKEPMALNELLQGEFIFRFPRIQEGT